jgi:hypothetical protein
VAAAQPQAPRLTLLLYFITVLRSSGLALLRSMAEAGDGNFVHGTPSNFLNLVVTSTGKQGKPYNSPHNVPRYLPFF